jgi:hypothetical protein
LQLHDFKALKNSRIQDLLDEFLRDRKPQKLDILEAALEAKTHKTKIG